VYVVAEAVTTPQGRRTVVAAGSLDVAVAKARQAATFAAAAGAGSLLVVAAITWLVVGRALRPVEQLRTQVTAITASGDLTRRVPQPPARDEIGRLADTLNEMLYVLQQADQQQRRFVADAAHELRTPLAGITAFLEVAANHPATIDRADLVDQLLDAHRRFSNLVNDLLTLASIDAGAPNRHRPVDLSAVIADCLSSTVTGPVSVQATVNTPAVVMGSDTQLSRVVTNLLDNALRHASHHVAIDLTADTSTAAITVTDDGPGVPADQQEQIWQRFVRLDDDRGRASGGTGLGLALVREIVTAHGVARGSATPDPDPARNSSSPSHSP